MAVALKLNTSMSALCVACSVFATTAIVPANVLANGRFPFAQSVIVGPAGPMQQIVLRATFGLVWSHDAGRTFQWVCEQSIGFEGNWDPPTVFGASALHVGLPDGLTESTAGCTFSRNASVGRTPIIDLAATANGATIFAIEAVPVAENRLFISNSGGADFVVGARTPAGLILDTVEFAPSNIDRVYVTGTDPTTRIARIFRSDDRGSTINALPALEAGITAAFVSGVAATNPDDVWIRVQSDRGSRLLRSLNGGATFREQYRGVGELVGFALADDGRVWVGGPDDGLQFSRDGSTFASISTVKLSCLRHRDRALYVCADWLNEPFALARWTDGEAAMVPLLQFDQIRGPAVCDPQSSTQIECAPRWPVLQQTLRRRPIDGGIVGRDSAAITDVTSDAFSPLDAGASVDASVLDDRGSSRPSTCACRTATPVGPYGALIRHFTAIIAVLSVLRRRVRTLRGDRKT